MAGPVAAVATNAVRPMQSAIEAAAARRQPTAWRLIDEARVGQCGTRASRAADSGALWLFERIKTNFAKCSMRECVLRGAETTNHANVATCSPRSAAMAVWWASAG